MLLTRAVAIACLTMLGWMLWLVAGLMAVLLIVGRFRPDASGLLAGQGAGALIVAGFAVFGIGWGCLSLARRFERGV